MNRNAFIYTALFLVMTVSGIFGSCFLLIVSGALMLFRAIVLFEKSSHWKKSVKIAVSSFFILLSTYYVYYGALMLLNTIDYASFRPEVWLFLPIVITFIVLFFMLSDAIELHKEEQKEETQTAISPLIEDMTVFSIIAIGYFGTFILDFYFEYAAAICTVFCLYRAISNFIKKNPQSKPQNTDTPQEQI